MGDARHPEAKEVEALLATAWGAADPQFAYSLLRKFFINCVANLLAIVGDCNCNGLLANHRPRMETLYDEMMDVLAEAHADGFAALPEDFRDVVFSGLATYGEHFPSTKLDFDAGRALEIDSLNGYVCRWRGATDRRARRTIGWWRRFDARRATDADAGYDARGLK